MRELPADLALQLIDDARLKPREVDERLRRASDADYWRGLAPALHVDGDVSGLEAADATSDEVADAVRAMHDQGVVHVRGAIASSTLDRLNDGIDRIVAAGWPAAFAFVYDEFWLCARAPAIQRLVTDVLGSDAAQVPHVWTHIVQPSEGAAGWGPHVDGSPDGRLSCWIALTDATLDNGCMHVIPSHLAPPHFAERLDVKNTFSGAELVAALQATTAVPAAAGDVLGWRFDVVHWGGRVRKGRAGRRSLSFEYIAATERPHDDERPTLPLEGDLPALVVRLRAIGAGLLQYRKFEPLLKRFEDLARELEA